MGHRCNDKRKENKLLTYLGMSLKEKVEKMLKRMCTVIERLPGFEITELQQLRLRVRMAIEEIPDQNTFFSQLSKRRNPVQLSCYQEGCTKYRREGQLSKGRKQWMLMNFKKFGCAS